MKISDVVIGGVYRYTFSGPATAPLNKRGPWLVGIANEVVGGHIRMIPAMGLPLARDRHDVANGELFALPQADYVHVVRIDGMLCRIDKWYEWLDAYTEGRMRAAKERHERAVAEHDATVRLVAALTILGHDPGRGPWDRSTPWGQFVDDLRRRELPIIVATADAFDALAGDVADDDERAAAEAWLTSKIS